MAKKSFSQPMELPLGIDPRDDKTRPLADRMRPRTLEEVIGQKQLVGEGARLRQLLEAHKPVNVIFWGPPGTGKTTLARLMANYINAEMVQVSPISHGAADLKAIFEHAKNIRQGGHRTLLFVDEIHRFNRAQQDLFLPYIEDGTIVLVGATTENPSFELNGALLSRCQVLVLEPLSHTDLRELISRAEEFLKKPLPLTEEAKDTLAALCDGDARYLLTLIEDLAALSFPKPLDEESLLKHVQQRMPHYDKSRDGHYNLISALHKSLRGSDPDAGLYWFCRMLAGGEDPRYIARRLIRFASEDIGMADPEALVQALSGLQAYEILGSPEGELNIAQTVVYLATAPKSNALYMAYKGAKRDAKQGSPMPPKIILNAPTKLMEQEGYSNGYIYDHDTEEAFSGQDYFPPDLGRQKYYNPAERGFEREITKRLAYWQGLREKKNGKD